MSVRHVRCLHSKHALLGVDTHEQTLTADILPSSLSAPTFYLASGDESVLEPFVDAAAAALDRVAHLPIVKQLLDTLDLATSSTSSCIFIDAELTCRSGPGALT